MTNRDVQASFDIEVQFQDELFPEVYPLQHWEEPAHQEGIFFVI